VSESRYDIVIVGAGPAGLAAGLYAARMNLRAVVLDQGPVGGQLLNTELIEDYPGFESILGTELATKMGDHAKAFGLDVREFEPVEQIALDGDDRVVRLVSGDELRAPAVIMAAGGLPRKLGVPGEAEFAGRGVSYCAVCDGAFFKNQELAVIGGGDAALEEGEFLTRYASKVYVIHRRGEFRAQPILQERARRNEKVEFPVGGVFIFIGFVPNSQLLKEHADHDANGYLVTDRDMRTSIPGIWAVGDVRSQLTKQIATAVGDGTTAAVAASQYLDSLRDRAPETASAG
jgi:thioredoxin reductase (NADPH)